jgi:hypothetical protein
MICAAVFYVVSHNVPVLLFVHWVPFAACNHVIPIHLWFVRHQSLRPSWPQQAKSASKKGQPKIQSPMPSRLHISSMLFFFLLFLKVTDTSRRGTGAHWRQGLAFAIPSHWREWLLCAFHWKKSCYFIRGAIGSSLTWMIFEYKNIAWHWPGALKREKSRNESMMQLPFQLNMRFTGRNLVISFVVQLEVR